MKHRPQPAEPQSLRITGLGAQGDGIADTASGQRYVAFALPGETVRASGKGLPELLSEASPERRAPLCRHFGACGGCVAQHMSERLYAEWKRDMVVAAFRQRGLDIAIAPLVRVSTGSRRRAVFTARRQGERVSLGYLRHGSHDLVDIAECPVLRADIVAQLPALRAIAAAMPAREVRLTVLATRAGLDIAADGSRAPISGATAAGLAHVAARNAVARLTIAGETMVERVAPAIPLGGIDTVLPPGTFVQAVAEAEAEMTRLVLGATSGAGRVADLFCGAGTFALALAPHARVLAVDGNAPAIATLAAAARSRQGLKPIETKVRDLFREPLSAKELAGFDAVVFDPPRAGARSQAQELAQSRVGTVVAVSCDPGTLARDVRMLADGGYAIESVTPIDQFLFSAHVEIVAVLRRLRSPPQVNSAR